MSHDLEEKVRHLSQYLDDDAVAQALRITPEAVRGILEGRANIRTLHAEQIATSNPATIKVESLNAVYRQKVVSIFRAKGGVGCTAIAIGLAYLLSREVKVLLVDLNFANGGSDLSYYLNLPNEPSLGDSENYKDCILTADSNLHVIQAPKSIQGMVNVEALIGWARQEYDVIIIDLPNQVSDLTTRALLCSNTILTVTSGTFGEMVRLTLNLPKFSHKDIVVVANQGNLSKEIKSVFSGHKIVYIERDSTLNGVLEQCEFPREKSIFMKGIKQLADVVFEREKKGLLTSLFNR